MKRETSHKSKTNETKKKGKRKTLFAHKTLEARICPDHHQIREYRFSLRVGVGLPRWGIERWGERGQRGTAPTPPLSSLPLEPIPFFSAHITARALPERARTRRTAVSASPFWIGNCPLARPLPALLSPRTTRARKYKKLCCVVFVLRCVVRDVDTFVSSFVYGWGCAWALRTSNVNLTEAKMQSMGTGVARKAGRERSAQLFMV